MKIFDAHNHIIDWNVAHNESTCSGTCSCSTSYEDWNALLIAPRLENSRIALGIHPWYCASSPYDWLQQLENHLQNRSDLWLGECGLDPYRAQKGAGPSLDVQNEIWLEHVKLAKKYQRPLIIHCVNAFSMMSPLLKTLKIPFLMHRFTGSREEIRSIFAWGGMVSIHAKSLERSRFCKTLEELGPHGFLIESDALPNDKYWPDLEAMLEKLSVLWRLSTLDLRNLLWLQSHHFFFPPFSPAISDADST